MERFRSDDSRELFAEVLRFTRHALRYPPEEAVSRANNLKGSDAPNTPVSTSDAIGTSVERELGLGDELDESNGRMFLGAALLDTFRIMEVIAKKYPNLPDETIEEAMSCPETIDTIALLALRSDEELSPYIMNRLPETAEITPDPSLILTRTDDLEIDNIGCPAAGYVATDEHEGHISPLPVFKALIPWATKAHLLSDEWRELREKLEK